MLNVHKFVTTPPYTRIVTNKKNHVSLRVRGYLTIVTIRLPEKVMKRKPVLAKFSIKI